MNTGIVASRVASSASFSNLAAPQPGAPNAGSLLPAPLDVGGDAMMALMALMSKSREIGKQDAQARVNSNSRERKEAIAREFQAYQEAARARESGGFWGKVGKACSTLCKVAAVAGAVAAAVATGGAGAPGALAIAGAVLSAGAFAQGETKFLQAMGVSDSTAAGIQMGMTIGGAACTVGSSLAAGASSKAAEAAANAGESGNKVVGALQTTQRVAGGVQAVGGVASGVANIKASEYEADATEHLAEALSQQMAREKLERMLRQLLEELEQDDKSAERAIGSLRGAVETRGSTLMTASMMRA